MPLRFVVGLTPVWWLACVAPALWLVLAFRISSGQARWMVALAAFVGVSGIFPFYRLVFPLNAIAQTFVDNPTYFPQDVQANQRFQKRLRREVPLGRLVSGREDAGFAANRCSEKANCFVGQVFPICGGWVAR